MDHPINRKDFLKSGFAACTSLTLGGCSSEDPTPTPSGGGGAGTATAGAMNTGGTVTASVSDSMMNGGTSSGGTGMPAGTATSGGGSTGSGMAGSSTTANGGTGGATAMAGSGGAATSDGGASSGGAGGASGGTGGMDTAGSGGSMAGAGGDATAGAGGESGGTLMCSTETDNGMHSHPLTVPPGDAEIGFQEEPYTLEDGGTGHTHTLTISAYEFLDLQFAGMVTVISSEDEGHTHECVITCAEE